MNLFNDALPQTNETTKMKLLEARFRADHENSNSQTSFDSPSLNYHLPPVSTASLSSTTPSTTTTTTTSQNKSDMINSTTTLAVPSWQRMQNPPPVMSALKTNNPNPSNNKKQQANPQRRKSVVIVVQESSPANQKREKQNELSNDTTTTSNRRKRKSIAPKATVITTKKLSPLLPEKIPSPPMAKLLKTSATPTSCNTHPVSATKSLDAYYKSSSGKHQQQWETPTLTSLALQKQRSNITTTSAALPSTINWEAKCQEALLELADAKSQLRAIHNNRSILQLSLENSLQQSRRELQTLKDDYERRLTHYKDQLIHYWQETARREWQERSAAVASSYGDTERRRQELEVERTLLHERREQLLKDTSLDTNSKNRLLQVEQVSTRQRQIRRLDKDEENWKERYKMYQNDLHVLNRQRKLFQAETQSRFGIQVLHERYVLTRLIGKGGFSEVWRANDADTGQVVAVKIHQLDRRWSDAKKANYTKHVSREYDIHRSVQHDYIVRLLHVFEIDADSFATVLEFSNGTDLDAILKEQTRLAEPEAKSILLQVLTAMQYLSQGDHDNRPAIIHYDLKPANILLDEHGNVKITDFGLSKILEAENGVGSTMELTSQGAGTYWYLPPECFLTENARISNKVDVWSIGVIYYQMLVGKRPFGEGQTQDAILADNTILNTARTVHFPDDVPLSGDGRDFIRACLMYDQVLRPTIAELCSHPYIISAGGSITDSDFGR